MKSRELYDTLSTSRSFRTGLASSIASPDTLSLESSTRMLHPSGSEPRDPDEFHDETHSCPVLDNGLDESSVLLHPWRSGGADSADEDSGSALSGTPDGMKSRLDVIPDATMGDGSATASDDGEVESSDVPPLASSEESCDLPLDVSALDLDATLQGKEDLDVAGGVEPPDVPLACGEEVTFANESMMCFREEWEVENPILTCRKPDNTTVILLTDDEKEPVMFHGDILRKIEDLDVHTTSEAEEARAVAHVGLDVLPHCDDARDTSSTTGDLRTSDADMRNPETVRTENHVSSRSDADCAVDGGSEQGSVILRL